MIIRFGNLTVQEFADLADANFTDEEKSILESHRSDIADHADGTFHIFRDPLGFSVGEDVKNTVNPILIRANERKKFSRQVWVGVQPRK